MILTPSGERPIESIKTGEFVVGRCGDGGTCAEKVKATMKFLANGYLRINDVIEVTPTHPFWVGGKWIQAGELKPGDELESDQGERMKVASIEWINKGVRVLNLDVGMSSTFYANDILVHNKEIIK